MGQTNLFADNKVTDWAIRVKKLRTQTSSSRKSLY